MSELASLQPAALGGAVLGGAVAGSTAGAAMVRWPRGERLRTPPRSRCDACASRLVAVDLVPILSWLALRGRCRSCGHPIGWSVLAMEVGTVVLTVAFLLVHGPTSRAVFLALGGVALLVATGTDMRHRIIPDRLTLPLALLGGTLVVAEVVAARPGPHGPTWSALAWAVAVPGVLRIIAAVGDRRGRARPIGGGDIKLLVGVLALVAVLPRGPAALLLITVLLAGSVAVLGLLTGRLERRSRMPLAPAIAAAYVLVVLAPAQTGELVAMLGGGTWLR